MEALNLFMPGELLKQACESCKQSYTGLLSSRDVHGCTDPHVARLSGILNDELVSGGIGNRLYVESILTALSLRLAMLRTLGTSRRTPRDSRTSLTRRQIKIAQQFIQDNLASDLGLKDVSASIGLSEFHFARCFRQSTGTSPHQYLTRIRVEKAQALLREPARPLAEIAVAVGLGTQSQFGRVFKRVTGATPGEYRRSAVSHTMRMNGEPDHR
jgi:AraC family transcriptional regulator